MESTGVHWKPVYATLEGYVDLIVGNAHHIKNVPGRKTDEGRRMDRPIGLGRPGQLREGRQAEKRRDHVFLKSALFAAASAAVQIKGSYYRDEHNRLRAIWGRLAQAVQCSLCLGSETGAQLCRSTKVECGNMVATGLPGIG